MSMQLPDASSVLLCVCFEASAFTKHPLLMLRDVSQHVQSTAHCHRALMLQLATTLLPSSRDTWLIDARVPKATHCHTIMALNNDDHNVSDRLHRSLDKALGSILSQV